MKFSAAVVLGAAGHAWAQSYTTSTFIECTSAEDVTYTSTNTITSTYCSECTDMTSTPTPTSYSVPAGATVHTTVYPVTYVNVCPTGYITQTFTVTEKCTGATPSFSGPGNSQYVPPGFTTAYVPCHVCEETPVTNMMTFPISQGPTAPVPTPAETPGTDSSPPAKETASPSPSPSPTGQATPPAEESCTTCGDDSTPTATPGTSPAGSSASSSAGTSADSSPAPSSYIITPNALLPSGSPAPAGNTSGITPYSPNSAPGVFISFWLASIGIVAMLAFLL